MDDEAPPADPAALPDAGSGDLAVALLGNYLQQSATVPQWAERVVAEGKADRVASDLRVLAAHLARELQVGGSVPSPRRFRQAVAEIVAPLLPPELELAVINAWEAYSLGEEEASEHFIAGDPLVRLHMLAAYCTAVGNWLMDPGELLARLRLASEQ